MTHNFITAITQHLESTKQPKFRLKQIQEGFYKHFYKDFDQFTNLPKDLLSQLKELDILPNPLKVIHTSTSTQSQKVLFETKSGNLIEAVLLIYLPNENRSKTHHALCVSSQSGCALACQFCATGAIGFKQNLSADEIVGQALHFLEQGINIDSIIFMGMGEPLANEEGVFGAIDLLTDPTLVGLSPHRLTISTVGLIPGIKKITNQYPKLNVAFSLHNPFDEERQKIMPVTKAYPIKDVFQALNEYIEITKNRVFIAYTLLEGENDTPKHAQALCKLIKSQDKASYLYHVNLIRYHPCPSTKAFNPSSNEKIKRFQQILEVNHISNTLRQDFGVEIDAACGQLYASYLKKD